jgi:hypothetical protein
MGENPQIEKVEGEDGLWVPATNHADALKAKAEKLMKEDRNDEACVVWDELTNHNAEHPIGSYQQVSDEDRAIEDASEAYTVEVTTDIDVVMDETWEYLVKQNGQQWPDIMQRAGVLVRYSNPQRTLEAYPTGSLQMRMARTMEFFTTDAKGKEKPVEAPRKTAAHLVERTEHPGAPAVDLVARLPFLGKQRRLVTEPGYHADECVLLVPDLDVQPPQLHTDPDVRAQEVAAAVHFLLEDWWGDFTTYCGWDDDPASRANALAFALTPFVRPYIDGATPMHICDAPDAGCGKSTVAELVGIITTGGISSTHLEKWGSEFKREVTSFLMEGKPIVWFDNEESGSQVDSAMLAQLTSGLSWTGRVMGKTKMPDLPIRNAWVMTGTNISFTKELADRGVLISLRPGHDGVVIRHRNPKDLKHPDIEKWTREHRTAIVEAILVLIDNWTTGGVPWATPDGDVIYDPIEPENLMGSNHREWARCVGGIIRAAGIDGFLGNRSVMRDKMDSETSEIEGFLGAVLGDANLVEFVTSDLAERCGKQPLIDQLPQKLAEAKNLNAELGNWLKGHKDTWHGPYRITNTGPKSHKRWTLERR